MSVSPISFNAKVPRNTSVGFQVREPKKAVFVAASHWPSEQACFTVWKSPAYRAYGFADYQIARRAVKEKSESDDNASRNALWALNQLETFTYAPEVSRNADGTFSFEWNTDRGSGFIQIGAEHSAYQVQAFGSAPIKGAELACVESYVGMLVNTLLYPVSASAICIADPNVSAQFVSYGCPTQDFTTVLAEKGDRTQLLVSTIKQVFAIADRVEFEDGNENEFTLGIIDLVQKHGTVAVERIARLLTELKVSNETTAQTLLCLGRIDDPSTLRARSRVAREVLTSPSAIVRDAATIAIDSMADRDATTELRMAIERESVPSLRKDMESVLAYLETAP